MKLIIFQVTDNASLESETGRTQAEKAFIQPQSLPRCKIGWFFFFLSLSLQQSFGGVKISWQHSGHMADNKTKGNCFLRRS